MITAGILAGAAAIYVTNYAKNNAEEMDLYSLKYNQNQTTILYYYDEDQNIQELARLHGVEDRIWIDFDKIPERLQQAFIAIEDERFYTTQRSTVCKSVSGNLRFYPGRIYNNSAACQERNGRK